MNTEQIQSLINLIDSENKEDMVKIDILKNIEKNLDENIVLVIKKIKELIHIKKNEDIKKIIAKNNFINYFV